MASSILAFAVLKLTKPAIKGLKMIFGDCGRAMLSVGRSGQDKFVHYNFYDGHHIFYNNPCNFYYNQWNSTMTDEDFVI